MTDVVDRFVKRFDRFGGQRYEQIKRRCQSEAILWEDGQFPAVSGSLWASPPDGLSDADISWLRQARTLASSFFVCFCCPSPRMTGVPSETANQELHFQLARERTATVNPTTPPPPVHAR
jgi:hypothetical protein